MGREFTEAEEVAMMGNNHLATFLMLGGHIPHIYGGTVILGPLSGVRAITYTEGYWQAEGFAFRFSDSYYSKMEGRFGAPFLTAQEILDTGIVAPDPLSRMGFVRVTNGINELVYNPSTGEIWHMQPLK
jgi:filamentous hemagglutinin